jgi:hypothetical protein
MNFKDILPKNDITVRYAFNKFKGFKEPFCDDSTCKYYEQNLNFFFDFLEQEYEKPIDCIPMDSMTPDVVQNHIKYLRFKP